MGHSPAIDRAGTGAPPDYYANASGTSSGSTGPAPFVPSSGDPWDYEKASHLLRRAMTGPTEEEIRTAVVAGLDATLDTLFQPYAPPLDMIADFAGKIPNTGPPEPEGPRYDRWVWEKLGRRYRLAMWWIEAAVRSPVSITERMALFWLDHLPIEMSKVEFAEYAYDYGRLLRSDALGNFRGLIHLVTRHPAMLIFLDGGENTVRTPNENYARELLELFTVGRVDREGRPNYTQDDVREGARGLTGFRTQSDPVDDSYRLLTSRFTEYDWDSGEKTFLGRTGKWLPGDIINIIFEERPEEIAWFICRKLYREFVYAQADETIVAEMASLLLRSDWKIAPVVRALLGSAHFFSRENRGCKPKSFIEFVAGMIRQLGLREIPDFTPHHEPFPPLDLFYRFEGYGHLPFHPPNVSGWPDDRTWVSPANLAYRIRFSQEIALGNVRPSQHWKGPLLTFDPIAFAKGFPGVEEPRTLCREIATYLFGVPPSPYEEEMLLTALLDGGPSYEWEIDNPAQRADVRIRAMLATLFEQPKFQLY